MGLLRGWRARWAALGAIVVALTMGGIAYASIPDAGGLFHACYKKVGGQVRLVESASDCNSNETATSWGKIGPTGAQGVTGAKGATGAKGTTGTHGAAGISGGGTKVSDSALTNSCQTVTLNSQALTLSEPAKLFVSFTGTYSANGTPDIFQARFGIEVKDATSTTIGTIEGAEVFIPGGNGFATFASAGIVGTLADASIPVTLPAGDYTILLKALTTGLCDGSEHGVVENAAQTYLIVGA